MITEVKLADICDIRSGGTPSRRNQNFYGGKIPWAKIGDMEDDERITKTEEYITEEGLSAIRGRIFPTGTLLFAIYGSMGKMAFAGTTISTNQAILGIQPLADDKINLRYLFHYLNQRIHELQFDGRGVTQKNLSATYLRNLKIRLPPVEEQRRIAAKLDKADAIYRKRKSMFALANDIIYSVFLERFGNPASNPKKFPVAPIKHMGEIITGNTPPRKEPENFGPGIEWIKSDNIRSGHHILTEAKETLSEKGRVVARIAPAGATLVTCIAGSPKSIGNAALADREVAFNQQINAVAPSSDVDSYFLYCQFCIAKQLVQGASTNSMKGMVSKGKFQEIEFICPPTHEQREFGLFFDRMMAIIEELNTASDSSEVLVKSLSQRAFRGEL